MRLFSLLVLFNLIVTSNIYATSTSLVGVWKLTKSENILPDGSVVSYCTGVHGYIMYTEEGYMSVSLNCGPKESDVEEPADISGRKFFYAGTYTYDGETVTHHLENASDVHLIGENPSRKVSFDGDVVILSGENQGTTFSAYWKKVEKK